MLKMRVHGLICGGVVLVQWAPPSNVAWMSPSPVPAHSTFTSSGDGESAVTDPSAVAVTPDAYLPELDGISHFSPRVRSPLIAVQLCPPLTVFQTPEVA